MNWESAESRFVTSLCITIFVRVGQTWHKTSIALRSTILKGPNEDDFKNLFWVYEILVWDMGSMTDSGGWQYGTSKVVGQYIIGNTSCNKKPYRSHSSTRKSATFATSKDKESTESLTEAELIGINDVLSQVLWT